MRKLIAIGVLACAVSQGFAQEVIRAIPFEPVRLQLGDQLIGLMADPEGRTIICKATALKDAYLPVYGFYSTSNIKDAKHDSFKVAYPGATTLIFDKIFPVMPTTDSYVQFENLSDYRKTGFSVGCIYA